MPIAVPTAAASSAPRPPPSSSTPATADTAAAPVQRNNPMRLGVVQQDTPGVSDSGPSTSSSAETDTLRRAAVKKATLQRKVEKWMDRLMEETVDRATFKRTVSHFTPPQYLEVAHERHLNSLCSYPLCPKPPARPYSAAKRFVISTRARTIKPAEGNEEEGYCTKVCRVRSGWVERKLTTEAVWLRGTVEDVELLEEMEERGEIQLDEEKSKERGKGLKGSTLASTEVRIPSTSAPQPPVQPKADAPPATPAAAKPAPPIPGQTPAQSAVSALLANLTIVERPTPVTPPVAPSLAPDPSLPTPPTISQPSMSATPQPLPLPQRPTNSSPSSTARDARRGVNSLISAPTSQLASTFISASRGLGPVGQEDESEEEEDDESGWEKEMAWGEEDDEMRALFDEAAKARELLDQDTEAS
ncbi:hypothetical protein IAT38_005440 [Cryptococcus sp. DSM 104549]